MEFVPVPNTFQVNFIQTFQAQRIENTLYFLNTDSPTMGDLDGFAAELATAWSENMSPLLSTNLTLDLIVVTNLTTSTGALLEYPLSPGIPGTISEEVLPTQDAIVVRFNTGVRGRSNRGRIYVSGMTVSSITNGTVEPTVIAALTDAVNTLAHAGAGDGFSHVVVSRIHDGVPLTTGAIHAVTSYAAQPVVAIQRRRRLGSGI